MRNIRRSWAAAVILGVAVGLTACGEDSKSGESREKLAAEFKALPKHLQKDFEAGDKNGDLRIQDSELTAMIEEDFAASDVDKDGEMTEADFRDGLGDHAKAVKGAKDSLEQFDMNNDGRVPLEEYAKNVERDFMRHMDTNKDGHLDPDEVSGFYEQLYDGKEESK